MSIRFKRIPYDKSTGGARYEKVLRAEDFGRMRGVSTSNESFLINESIQFYNYGLYTLMGRAVVEKSDWTPFHSETVARAINSLHEVFVEDIYQMAQKLAYMKKGRAVNLPSQVNNEAKKWSLDSANVGMFAASLFISDQFRNPARKLLLGGSSRHKVLFREFEKLPAHISELRKLFNKSLIDNTIEYQYSKFLHDDVRSYLFDPYWGGTAIIMNEDWDAEHPFWPYPNDQMYKNRIGPTEKLYHSAASGVFDSPRTSSISSSQPDIFLSAVEKRVGEIEKVLPSYLSDRRLKIWQGWNRNLIALEEEFLSAVHCSEKVNGAERHPGVLVGLPCTFALIGILRTYLADLMARTLMVAFSNTIMSIYKEVNGYMAVQLWEALTGKGTEAVTASGALHRWSLLGLEGGLRTFRTLPKESAWSEHVPEEARAVKIFKDLLNRPLLNAESYNKKTSFYKRQVPLLGDDLKFDALQKEYLPYYPVITSEFYRLFDLDRKHSNDLLYGARFTAQAHAYIAFQLLANGLQVLGLDEDFDQSEWERFKDKDNKGYNKHRRHLKNFRIGAGSYIWGGRKQPHYTHRHGINFDFSFGPVIQPWTRTKFQSAIRKLKNIRKLKLPVNGVRMSGRKLIENIIKQNPKLSFLSKNVSPVIIGYTKNQTDEPNSRRKIIFRRLVQNININEQLGKVRHFCSKTMNSETFDSAKEEEAYQLAEKQLLGTPHYINYLEARKAGVEETEVTELSDWQRTYIAHIALMLSAPRTIIFASPIVHFRAMRVIRRAFSADGVYMLSIEPTDEILNELDNSRISDEFQSLCRDNEDQEFSISFSENAKVIPEKPGNEWRIIDGYHSYRLKLANGNIKIDYLIPAHILKLTAEIVKDTSFSFEPEKHHHHWHVDYCDEAYARYSFNNKVERYRKLHSEKKAKEKALADMGRLRTTLTSMVNGFDRYSDLWLMLGIDLAPFARYLRTSKINKRISSASNIEIWNVPEEKQNLQQLCDLYIKQYHERFGANSKSEPETLSEIQRQSHSIADALLSSLFRVLESKPELTAPTITYQYIQNAWNAQPMQQGIKLSREVINVLLKPHLLAHKLLEEKDFEIFKTEESEEEHDYTDEEMEDFEISGPVTKKITY